MNNLLTKIAKMNLRFSILEIPATMLITNAGENGTAKISVNFESGMLFIRFITDSNFNFLDEVIFFSNLVFDR